MSADRNCCGGHAWGSPARRAAGVLGGKRPDADRDDLDILAIELKCWRNASLGTVTGVTLSCRGELHELELVNEQSGTVKQIVDVEGGHTNVRSCAPPGM